MKNVTRTITALVACTALSAPAWLHAAPTDGFVQYSSTYNVQNWTSGCGGFKDLGGGEFNTWVCAGESRVEMRWDTWPNQNTANQFECDAMFDANTQNTAIHQIKSNTGGEVIYLQVQSPGTLRNDNGAVFATGMANTWFHINSIFNPTTGQGLAYINGSLMVSRSYPTSDRQWYFKNGCYNNGLPAGGKSTAWFKNIKTWIQSSSAPVSAPAFSPLPGTYASTQTVSIGSTTSGASIRYTIDGSTPTETHGTLYSSPVTISSTSTLEAIAYKSGLADSTITSGTYTINTVPSAAAPVFSPAGGTYTSAQDVTITSATSGASIRYTTDGSTPSETAGTIYSGPVHISATTVLEAIAYASGFTDSAVTSATYTINVAPPPTLNFEAESLSYTGSGATTSVQTDTNSSGGKWVELAGNSTGDHIDFTVPNVPAGTYQLKMEWKGNNTRGILQLSVDGTNLGSTLDQYASGQTYPTTTFGNVTFSTTGNHDVRLTVTGKNSKSSSYQLSADKFTLVGQ